MLTCRVAGAGPDLARRNHGILAALVLACVMGFWGWQWTEAPNNAVAQDALRINNHHHNERHHDDND